LVISLIFIQNDPELIKKYEPRQFQFDLEIAMNYFGI